VWCRVGLDVLKIKNDTASITDWKTGKLKPDSEQLMLYATAVFIHHPEVQEIEARLVFLKQDTGPHIPMRDCFYGILIRRYDLLEFWEQYEHKVNALHHAVLTTNFPPQPSGLCRAHCPVTSCEHNGGYR
jgi:hypothetical protein